MSKSGKMAMMYGILAYAASTGGNPIYDTEESKPKESKPKEIKRKPPKGCKEYFFTEGGECFTVRYEDTEFVFSCYAINIKSAVKKFNRWQN
jgi:hypothetical protein